MENIIVKIEDHNERNTDKVDISIELIGCDTKNKEHTIFNEISFALMKLGKIEHPMPEENFLKVHDSLVEKIKTAIKEYRDNGGINI